MSYSRRRETGRRSQRVARRLGIGVLLHVLPFVAATALVTRRQPAPRRLETRLLGRCAAPLVALRGAADRRGGHLAALGADAVVQVWHGQPGQPARQTLRLPDARCSSLGLWFGDVDLDGAADLQATVTVARRLDLRETRHLVALQAAGRFAGWESLMLPEPWLQQQILTVAVPTGGERTLLPTDQGPCRTAVYESRQRRLVQLLPGTLELAADLQRGGGQEVVTTALEHGSGATLVRIYGWQGDRLVVCWEHLVPGPAGGQVAQAGQPGVQLAVADLDGDDQPELLIGAVASGEIRSWSWPRAGGGGTSERDTA
ncbi:MAG: FG-GAP repeat protein [Fimbriimonadaceae bacterium]|nr:FG-GAP repeat protein [Fimbriimonadaceae bacterium]